VRGLVTLLDLPGEYLQVLGIDVFTNEAFRTFELSGFGSGGGFDVQSWLGDPQAIAISEEFARLHRLAPGQQLRARVNGGEHTLRVAFVMRSGGGVGNPDEHIAAMDIGWAQELLGQRGSLTGIQLLLTDPRKRDEIAASLRPLVPPDAGIASPAQRNQQVENMLGGFQLNLTAMSLVSLLVGMFLIYNTVSASVVRRRREIGILRSLGVTRERSARFVPGRSGGARSGRRGGRLRRRRIARAGSGRHGREDDLVALRSAERARDCADAMDVWVGCSSRGALGGCGGVAAGGCSGEDAPCWRVARRRNRRGVTNALAGVVLVGIALHCGGGARVVSRPNNWSTVDRIWCGVLRSGRLLVHRAERDVAVQRSCRSASARLDAARGQNAARAHDRRWKSLALARANSVTIAALAAAVAMTIGVSVMVFSFRKTVEVWLDQTLAADLFIAPGSNEAPGPSGFMPPEAIRFLEEHPAVAAVDTSASSTFKSATVQWSWRWCAEPIAATCNS
jgi:putative ABC transport system permease protein